MKAELWRCPECGHRFVTKNVWHSCSNYTLEHHFDRASPTVESTFERFLEEIRSCGPVTVIPQKTRIAIQAEVRFASCVVRKKWLLANLWLTRRATHPTLRKTEEFGPRSFGLQFRFDSPADVDDALVELIGESYLVGLREHLVR